MPPNPQNLKPFKKGQSGNPKGRPRKLPAIDVIMAEVMGEDKDGITAAQAILAALRAKAARGDVRAAEVLLDRAYGKARQQLDVRVGDLEQMTDEQLKALAEGKLPT